jgi:oligopeptide transport system substrate-binding protein
MGEHLMIKMRVIVSVVCLVLSPLAALAADMTKTLNVAFVTFPTGYDPAKVSDAYSIGINSNIFDPLVTYDYLARPVSLIPNTIEAMPEITNAGKTYTMHIQPGIFFSADPIFGGVPRELTAADYVYSIKRHLDPTINSPWSYLVDGKFVGADEMVAAANGGALDYDTEVEGLRAIDTYTLEITLTATNYNFMYVLATDAFGAVAREAIEGYADNTNAHPVGTGPYILTAGETSSVIELEANPDYRDMTWDFAPNSSDPVSVQAAADMAGKQIPVIGHIRINVIEEEQPTWLSFLDGQLDYTGIPQPALRDALVINPEDPLDVRLADTYVDQGMTLQRQQALEVTYTFFNMADPVVGGYEPAQIALRRAIALAWPINETIARIRRGQAVPVQYIVPEGVAGNNPNFVGQTGFDPAQANALLDAAGYAIGPDGMRMRPDGSPLSVEFATGTSAIDREWNEFYQQAFDSIKVSLTFQEGQWSELAKASQEGTLQMWSLAWGADYPDGDNFMQLLYGPNTGDANAAGFDQPDYNRMYEESLLLPNGPERQVLYDAMNEIVVGYQPWIFGDIRVGSTIAHPNVKGLVAHPILNTAWRYVDLVE